MSELYKLPDGWKYTNNSEINDLMDKVEVILMGKNV